MPKKIVIGIITALILIIAVGVLFFVGREKPYYWYVEAGYEDAWARILRQAGPVPVKFAGIRVYSGANNMKNQGVIISTKPDDDITPLRVYPGLSRELQYQGAIVLALDPWMIFYKHNQPSLSYERIFGPMGGEGILLLPGAEAEAVQAWVMRLSQDGPGSFPMDVETPENAEFLLFSGGRFRFEFRDYYWQNALSFLLGNETAWLYAPLSIIRSNRNPRKQLLAAEGFPERDRNRYSLQATILWAWLNFSEKNTEKRNEIASWLKNPEIQTIIADELGWIPADPYGNPYDPVSRSSQMNWLTSSFVFEIITN